MAFDAGVPYFDDGQFTEDMRRRGATSATGALPRSDLPYLSPTVFEQLVERGILREGAPGRFYLYERGAVYGAPGAPAGRRMAILLAALGLLIMGAALAAFMLARS